MLMLIAILYGVWHLKNKNGLEHMHETVFLVVVVMK